jgi:hypothetical protein
VGGRAVGRGSVGGGTVPEDAVAGGGVAGGGSSVGGRGLCVCAGWLALVASGKRQASGISPLYDVRQLIVVSRPVNTTAESNMQRLRTRRDPVPLTTTYGLARLPMKTPSVML